MPNEHRSSGRTASSLVEEEVVPYSGLRFRCGVAVSGKRAMRRNPPASSAGGCSAWFGCTPVWRWHRQHSPACDGLPRAPACSRPGPDFDGHGRPQAFCAWSHTPPASHVGNPPVTHGLNCTRDASARHQRQPRIWSGPELRLYQQKADRTRTHSGP